MSRQMLDVNCVYSKLLGSKFASLVTRGSQKNLKMPRTYMEGLHSPYKSVFTSPMPSPFIVNMFSLVCILAA